LAGEIIDTFGDDVEAITLVHGVGGVFDVEMDGATVFSKHQAKRHPEPGEIVSKLQEMAGSQDGNVTWQPPGEGEYTTGQG